MSRSVPSLTPSKNNLAEPLQTLSNSKLPCELKINLFPTNKTLAPYHLSAAGREINEGGIVTIECLLSH